MKTYIARTRYGDRLHLVRNYSSGTLCGKNAVRPMQIVPKKKGKGNSKTRKVPISIEARDHWLADERLCNECRIALRHAVDKHDIEYVHAYDKDDVLWVRWWCTCGASAGTTWYGSNRQATLEVQKHLAEVEAGEKAKV